MTRPSVARSQQLVSDDGDDQLTMRARIRRPGVKHWWGRQSWYEPANPDDLVDGQVGPGGAIPQVSRTGAECYLCGTIIATWSSRWPVTEAARSAIEVHRQFELRRQLDQPASHTVEERP